MKRAFAVIMAGGRGERFWPLSTSATPKQLLAVTGGKPLIAMAADRLKGMIPASHVFIVTTADLVPAVRRCVPGIPAGNIVGEPVGRDTAAAVALASAFVRRRCRDGVFCILTADHLISPAREFRETLRRCLEAATGQEVLITIGVKPSFPSTGFGYIEAGRPDRTLGRPGFLKVLRFVEKPDQKTARRYLASGRFFWNSGMFVWSVDAIQNALRQHRPQLHEMARRIEPLIGTSLFPRKLAAEYAKLDRISIDYAVMEKSRNILMAKCVFDWDDVGSWAAVEKHFRKDASGNVVIGQGECLDSGGNIVMSRNRFTGLIGIKDLVVVHSDHATLVCRKDRAEDVKKLVKLMKDKGIYGKLL